MDTAIKHPLPGRVKPSFVIFDIRALWRSGLSPSYRIVLLTIRIVYSRRALVMTLACYGALEIVGVITDYYYYGHRIHTSMNRTRRAERRWKRHRPRCKKI